MIKVKPKKAPKATLTQLSKEMGVSISTVWRWRNDGIPGTGPLKEWREKHLKAALKKLGEQERAA